MAVSYDRQRKKWRGSIRENGKQKYIGRYPTKEEAQDAVEFYKQAKEFEDKQEKQLEKIIARKTSRPIADFFDIEEPIVEEPTLWGRIKSLWQKRD